MRRSSSWLMCLVVLWGPAVLGAPRSRPVVMPTASGDRDEAWMDAIRQGRQRKLKRAPSPAAAPGKGARLVVRLVTPEGARLSRWAPTLRPPGKRWTDALLLVEQEAGAYAQQDLPVGDWELFADVPGFAYVRQRITLDAGARVEKEIVLEPEAIVSGRVLVGTRAAAGAEVSAAEPDGEGTRANAFTDEAGAFTLFGLSPGEWRVVVKAPGGLTRVRTVQAPASGVTLRPEAPPSVSGRVTDEDGEPVARARLHLVKPGAPVADMPGFFSSSDGRFAQEAEAAGEWDLVVSAEDLLPTTQRVQLDGPVEVAVKLRRGGAIAGVVVDGEGAPVSGAMVSASGRGDVEVDSSATSDAQGRFVLTGFDRPVNLRASKAGRIQALLDGVSPGATSVRLVLGGKAPRVRGRLVDASGQAVTKYRFLSPTLTESPRGIFDRELAKAGPQRLTIHGEFVDRTVEFTVAPGEELDLGDVVVEAHGVVTGAFVIRGEAPHACRLYASWPGPAGKPARGELATISGSSYSVKVPRRGGVRLVARCDEGIADVEAQCTAWPCARDVTLTRGAVVRVRSGGRSRSTVTLECLETLPVMVLDARTNDAGEAVFEDLLPGRCDVFVEHRRVGRVIATLDAEAVLDLAQ